MLQYQLEDKYSGELREWNGEPEICHSTLQYQIKHLAYDVYPANESLDLRIKVIAVEDKDNALANEYQEKAEKYIVKIESKRMK